MALFTVAEAKAFVLGGETPLSSYTDAAITEAEARIKESFEDICGVAFESTSSTSIVSGDNGTFILLPRARVTAVTAVTMDGVAFSAGQLSSLKVYPYGKLDRDTSGYFTTGVRNVSVTYTHGHTSVPKRIKWAALVVAVEELTGSDITKRATAHTDDLGTFRLSVPDGEKERWYGIPAVDAILQQYSEKVPAVG